MSKANTLAKLQSLLERVRSRTHMPRNGQVGPAQAAQVAIDVEQPALLSMPLAVAAAQPAADDYDDSMDVATLPPPAALEPAADAEIPVEVDLAEPPPVSQDDSLAVSVEEGAAPLAAAGAPDEVASPGASESAERLVAAERAASEPPQVEVTFPSVPPAAPSEPVDLGAPPVPAATAAADEAIAAEFRAASKLEAPAEVEASLELDADGAVIPKAPASSRRPVAAEPEEQIAEVAFGNEEPKQPPRHTPPPESGRLPAGPIEEFDADVTGVRTAPLPGNGAPVEEPELAPIATRAPLASSESIVDVAGAPSAFVPTTFAAWLDATLAL